MFGRAGAPGQIRPQARSDWTACSTGLKSGPQNSFRSLCAEISATVLKHGCKNSKRSGLIALIYNWWSLFTKRVDEQIAREAITSRPMFLLHIAKMSTHQSMRTLVIFCAHVQAKDIQEKLEASAKRLKTWALLTAEQLKARLGLETNYRPYFSASPELWRPKLPGSTHACDFPVRKIEKFDRKNSGLGGR